MMPTPPIILLRQGTDMSQGKGQILSNIDACLTAAELVRTTLGPRGMDKLIYDADRKKTTISNDGATIMKTLEVAHPAASTLVDISISQDAEVGDGTTSVVVLAGEFLKEARQFVEIGVHPQVIIRGLRQALRIALKRLEEVAVSLRDKSRDELRTMLIRCAETTLQSKIVSAQKELFSRMCVDAVFSLGEDLEINNIGIKKVAGGSMQDSFLVDGVAFKKTFSYAGFEQQKKLFHNPKILLLDRELELKSISASAEVAIDNVDEYKKVWQAEWKRIYDELEAIVKSGAQIVLSRQAIGDLATQYFADRGVFCAGRVPDDDLSRAAKATGATVQNIVSELSAGILGTCELFEERQIGNERFNVFTGYLQAKTATIVIRGGADQLLEEADRSLHDAIMIIRRMMKHSAVVAGGGAIEMELSKSVREQARTIAGKEQAIMLAYARALEVIPRQLADNAGFDSMDIMNKLRKAHAESKTWFGVDIQEGGVIDTFETFVWEPVLIKRNALEAATEAACLILSVDMTVVHPQAEAPPPMPKRGGPGIAQQGMAGMMGRAPGVRAFKGRGGR